MRGFKHFYHLSTKRLKIQQTGTRMLETVCSCFIESKKGGKDQETIQLSTTPDPGYHMGK